MNYAFQDGNVDSQTPQIIFSYPEGNSGSIVQFGSRNHKPTLGECLRSVNSAQGVNDTQNDGGHQIEPLGQRRELEPNR